jgi:pimeloyl-ACP methyl ester carboxylesterase
MEITHGWAELNGTRLYYEMAGDGDPLVLIHGFSLDRRMWDPQFAVFARRYRVIRYDLRGFGRSALPDGDPFSHTADLAALLDSFGIARAHIVGLSQGGAVAVAFALAYAERVRCLVPVDAYFDGHAFSDAWEAGIVPVWQAAREGGAPAAKEVWLAHAFFQSCREQPETEAQLMQIVEEYSGWHWVNRHNEIRPDPPTAQRLEEVRARTLVIVGERDLPDFQVMAQALAARIPGAQLVVLPGVGHMANMEAPEQFNQIVLEFLGEPV